MVYRRFRFVAYLAHAVPRWIGSHSEGTSPPLIAVSTPWRHRLLTWPESEGAKSAWTITASIIMFLLRLYQHRCGPHLLDVVDFHAIDIQCDACEGLVEQRHLFRCNLLGVWFPRGAESVGMVAEATSNHVISAIFQHAPRTARRASREYHRSRLLRPA